MTDQPPALLGVTPPPEPILTCDSATYGHVGLIIRDDANVPRCSICGEEADPGTDEGMTVEVAVAGRSVSPFAGPPACEHKGATQQVEYAVVRNDEGQPVRREARVRLRCSSCGAPMRWVLDSVHHSDTLGERALVCSVIAMSDTEAADGWQVATEG